MNNRIDKVNSLLEHEISKIILQDFRLPGILTTITHVNTTANVIETKVYISVFPEEKSGTAMKILNQNIYEIQQQINRKLNMRPIPKIIFVHDKETAKANYIEQLFDKIEKKRKMG